MDKLTVQSKFAQSIQSCFYCRGYYGPSFGEPTCIACHQFLFSEDFIVDQFNNCRNSFEYPCYMASMQTTFLPEASEDEPTAASSSSFGKFDDKIGVSSCFKFPNANQLATVQEPVYKVPPEIWTFIFQSLDHVSLLIASKVNRMWERIALGHLPSQHWQVFVEQRWPLFLPEYNVDDWHSLCSDLLDSVPCKRCFINLNWNPKGTPGPDRSLRSVRLKCEIESLRKDPPFGIKAIPIDKLNFNWVARIIGPRQSAYEGGVFYLHLKVPINYPIEPPVIRFITKVYHPNISRHGDIGMDITGYKWTIATTIEQVLLSVQTLFENPFVEISMEPEIAALYKRDKAAFYQTALAWTRKYAMHEMHPH